ncbi:MAG: DUF3575 domain-containing protein [Bacteroidales bacterium]
MDSKFFLTILTGRKKVFPALSLLIISLTFNSVSAQTRQPSGILKFSEGSNILELKISGNRDVLTALERGVERNLQSIKDGEKHISIISYIRASETGDIFSINDASLRGSVVRAHFKIKYNLSNFNFTFHIDNNSSVTNSVKIEITDGSPSIHNNEIYYTTSKINSAVKAAIEKYGEVPYVKANKAIIAEEPANQKYKPKVTNRFTAAIPSMRFHSTIIQKSIKVIPTVSKSQNIDLRKVLSRVEKPVVNTVQLNITPDPQKVSLLNKKYYQPLFGIKSNLVYWYGLTPNLSKIETIPNAEVELFYSGSFSTSIEGFYTPFGEIATDAQEWFKESGIILEQKYWFGKSKRYNTLYLGIVGLYGDYDYRDLEKSELGLTGTYYGAGLSIGFLVPVYKGICFEIGVRGVYKLDNWESYKVRNGGFYREESGRNSGIDLSGVKFSFQYRFGKSRNN